VKIFCLFADRNWSDVPELMDAWDEYLIDANPDGWQSDKREAIAELEEGETWREVTIDVLGVENLFDEVILKGKITEL